MNNASDRINEVLSSLGIKASNLSKSLGFPRPQRIYDIQKGKVGISKDIAEKIVSTYPQFNYEWLIRGVGDMLNTLSQEIPFHGPTPTTQDNITMPREVFDQIQGLIGAVTSQQQTIASQQQMMADMVKNIDQAAVLKAISALDDKVDKKGDYAGSAGAVAG